MSEISIFGAGAFGTALAIALTEARHSVHLVARSQQHADAMNAENENAARLPGQSLPAALTISADHTDPALICLLAVPMQALGQIAAQNRQNFVGRTLVACCKGVDLNSGLGPTGTILQECPTSEAAILSGPGFAVDIARGLPTALTIAARSEAVAMFLQNALATHALRLYRSTDTTGVELGGALKNIMAIAAGVAIGAGLGESARAAVMSRGYEELKRFALSSGAAPDTLSGLSGLGDLILTCTSEKSRNFAHGLALGTGRQVDLGATVEGVATAQAVARLAEARDVDMPITHAVASLLSGDITVDEAVTMLLSRPLKEE